MNFRMRIAALAALGLASIGGSAAQAAPFDAISFRKGESALFYDVGSVTRDGINAHAWVYLIVRTPMDGASMVATYREFGCDMGRTRDISRRFVSPEGATLRAVETPGEWQTVNPGDDRFDLLDKVCAGKPARVSGQRMSIFDFQAVVREALMYGPK